MTEDIRLWHKKYKVKVISKTNGHALVEALDNCNGIKKGERFLTRIIFLEKLVKNEEDVKK